MTGELDLSTPGIPFLGRAVTSALSVGGTGILDMETLAFSFEAPALLDEIRFVLKSTVIDGPGANDNGYGGTIRVKLWFGDRAVTSCRSSPAAHVPVWLFGSQPQRSNEVAVDSAGAGMFNYYRWLLPKPLYLPAGMTLGCTVARTQDGIGGTIRTEVAYAGRVLPAGSPVPPRIAVPFVTAWIGDEGAAWGESSERDLVNPFGHALYVQRFTGRIQERVSGSLRIRDEAFATGAPHGFSHVNVQIVDSYGFEVVRRLTPFYSVFDLARRAWTHRRILEPGQRYNLRVQDTSGGITLTPMIGMIGWRWEPNPAGGG